MRRARFALISLVAMTAPTYAWHASGHKATARIAYEQLDQDQRRAMIAIVRGHPRFEEDFESLMPDSVVIGSDDAKAVWIFEQASIWPDLVPNISDEVRTQYHRGTWHYINLPVYLADSDEESLAGRLTHNMSPDFEPPLRQNLNVIQALRGNLRVWHDAHASAADKAVAFCWILHLVGDLHQPLHTVALFSRAYFPEGDRGGNSIAISGIDRLENLHAVWDGLPTNFANLDVPTGTRVFLTLDRVGMDSIEGWVRRHAAMARLYVYTDEVRTKLVDQLENHEVPTIELSQDYLAAASQFAKPQVILAGHRIAKLLTL